MKRIENVKDFVAAQEAVLNAKNSLRRLAGQPEIRWLFIPYESSDISNVPRKACCIPSIQSTYCICRERCQKSREVWNLIFSDGWAAKKDTQRFVVATSVKLRHKPVREASSVKAIQVANIARLRRKRELHERILAGFAAQVQDTATESSSEESFETSSAESSESD